MLRLGLLLVVLGAVACGGPPAAATPEADAGHLSGAHDAGVSDDAGVSLDAGQPDAGVAKRGPPYPIVLAHGFFGFDRFAGLDFFTYFFEVREALAAQGDLLVFTPAVDPFNSSERRSVELEQHIDAILARTGHAKVNVIAHSQGGLDARIVASRRPELFASVVTISTPHRGTPVSDVLGKGFSDPRTRAALDALVAVIASPLWSASKSDSSVMTAMAQFEGKTMAAFNARYVDPPGVAFFSVAGRSSSRFARETCDVDDPSRPDFISDYDFVLDPLTALLQPMEGLISPNPFDPVPHDGLVPVASAKWGTFLGCIPADHLDEVGQIGGAPPGLGNLWRHKPFYVALVQYLRAKGY